MVYTKMPICLDNTTIKEKNKKANKSPFEIKYKSALTEESKRKMKDKTLPEEFELVIEIEYVKKTVRC